MAYTVQKVEMWTGEIDDRVGALAGKLEQLASAGVDLEIVVARRQSNLPGRGVVFLGPITTTKGQQAAQAAGLRKATNLFGLRVEGPNKPGEGSRMARQVANAGINLRGLSATVIGKKVAVSLGFDNAADADKAAHLLGAAKRK